MEVRYPRSPRAYVKTFFIISHPSKANLLRRCVGHFVFNKITQWYEEASHFTFFKKIEKGTLQACRLKNLSCHCNFLIYFILCFFFFTFKRLILRIIGAAGYAIPHFHMLIGKRTGFKTIVRYFKWFCIQML